MRRRIVCAMTVATLFGLTGGCLSSPPTHFYTLSAEASAARNAAVGPTLRIALEPLTIPEIVNRPQFVVKSGPNTVSLIDDHRWAESLRREISRVLAENLSRILGTNEVWIYTQPRAGRVDYRLLVDVSRFETNRKQDISLDVLWTITRVLPSGEDQRTHGRSSVQRPIEGAGYQAIASAYSHALATVSQEMAAAIRSMREQAP
ncbi:MAG: membrane integrity-associated transporter subunit PqiC [Nitrospira sp.]|nr:membrane integrity-associated transporter subunit PqiC [Nitrospira sp.]